METKHNGVDGSTWDNGLSKESTEQLAKSATADSALENRWSEISAHYREMYPELSNENLTYLPGQFNELTNRIAAKTFRRPDEVRKEIQNWKPSLYKRYDL